MKKFEYWLYYSPLDFSAYIKKAPAGLDLVKHLGERGFDRHLYLGPYSTLSDAKKDGLFLIDEAIDEYKKMRESILGKPEKL